MLPKVSCGFYEFGFWIKNGVCQYTNILNTCGMVGWSIFQQTDEVKPFDGNITTGLCYVETNNWFPPEAKWVVL